MARYPDEDLGPQWLRDYGSIEADLRGMQDFANALRDELERNYLPHRDKVNDDMRTPVSAPASQFVELVELLHAHRRSQVITTTLLTAHGDATHTFSATAETISTAYGDADGLAVARAKDIEAIIVDPAAPLFAPATPTLDPAAPVVAPAAPTLDPAAATGDQAPSVVVSAPPTTAVS